MKESIGNYTEYSVNELNIIHDFMSEEESLIDGIERALSTVQSTNSSEAIFLCSALPELETLKILGTSSKPLWSHTVAVVSRMPENDVILRWAALYHDIGKPCTFGNQFKSIFANHEYASTGIWRYRGCSLSMEPEKISVVETIICNHMLLEQYTPSWTNKALKRLLERCGDQFDRIFALAIADGASIDDMRHLEKRKKAWIV